MVVRGVLPRSPSGTTDTGYFICFRNPKHETLQQSSVSFEGQPAPGRRKSSGVGSPRGRSSSSRDNSAERVGGGALPSGVSSALNHPAKGGNGEEKEKPAAIDERLSSDLAPRSVLVGAFSGRPKQNLPPIAVRKASGNGGDARATGKVVPTEPV